MPTSDHAHPKIIEITFSFPKFAPAWKIWFHSIHSFLRYSQFQSPVTRLTMSIFDMSTQKKFDQVLIYVNLYQHAKNQAIYMVDWKILQSGWLRTFWSISQEQKFSQIWDLFRNTANNISFHYTIKPVKINDHIFQYIQKTLFLAHFWSIFTSFGAKNFFPENPALSRTTSYKFLALCQNSEKTKDTIPKKLLDRRTDRPYFIGPFWLLQGVQKETAMCESFQSCLSVETFGVATHFLCAV